jgi:HemY protein
MVTMRLQLKAARLSGQPAQALETATLLAKHKAFSSAAAESLVSRLVLELISHTHDTETLQRTWLRLTPAQRVMPEVASQAVLRWLQLAGDPQTARSWLQDLWALVQSSNRPWSSDQLLGVVQALDACLPGVDAPDALVWLTRLESAQQAQPRAAHLQYLAGMLCLRHRLWGKAQGLLTQATKSLESPALKRKAWMGLAELAEQRQDAFEAAVAWKQAAQCAAN